MLIPLGAKVLCHNISLISSELCRVVVDPWLSLWLSWNVRHLCIPRSDTVGYACSLHHIAEVLAESVCVPATSFSNVQSLTAGANDGVNNTGRAMAAIRVVGTCSPSGERTRPASCSFARKCSSLFLIRVWWKGAVNQDFSKVGIPPINAHGCGDWCP